MKRVRRFDDIPGFTIDRVAAAAGEDPDVLRMENLDTDVPPPQAAARKTADVLSDKQSSNRLLRLTTYGFAPPNIENTKYLT